MRWLCRQKEIDLDSKTQIMGVINCTPDSFYSGSRRYTVAKAVETGFQMVADGADILDVGGESSRPGSDPVSEEEEMERVLPVIRSLAEQVEVPLSVDTTKAAVARAALEAGAHIINDISALQFDPQMADVISEYRAGVVLMHIKGRPKDMQQNPEYADIVSEIEAYFLERTSVARESGIANESIVLDPGLGFGKTLEGNYILLANLQRFHRLGYPLLLGPSRKSFIQKVLNLPAEECLEGTAALVAAGILNGAQIMRVHDVRAMNRVAQITDYYKKQSSN